MKTKKTKILEKIKSPKFIQIQTNIENFIQIKTQNSHSKQKTKRVSFNYLSTIQNKNSCKLQSL